MHFNPCNTNQPERATSDPSSTTDNSFYILIWSKLINSFLTF